MEGNQIERRPPWADQLTKQLMEDQRILVIGFGQALKQFLEVFGGIKGIDLEQDCQEDQQWLDQRLDQSLGALIFLYKDSPQDTEILLRKNEICFEQITTRSIFLAVDTEQKLIQNLKGQSYELWEVKQEQEQGIVLQHRGSKNLSDLKQLGSIRELECVQKPKQAQSQKQWRCSIQ